MQILGKRDIVSAQGIKKVGQTFADITAQGGIFKCNTPKGNQVESQQSPKFAKNNTSFQNNVQNTMDRINEVQLKRQKLFDPSPVAKIIDGKLVTQAMSISDNTQNDLKE